MAEKTACPSCGVENYDTDQVCMSCGASLTEPAPQKPQHEAIEESVVETPNVEQTKADLTSASVLEVKEESIIEEKEEVVVQEKEQIGAPKLILQFVGGLKKLQ